MNSFDISQAAILVRHRVCSSSNSHRRLLPQAQARLWVWTLACLSQLLGHSTFASPPEWETAITGIQEQRLREHTNVLASDTYEGREAGSRGGKAAGIYLVSELEKLKVSPVSKTDYYQEFGDNYRNILGLVRGRDSELRDECILVGAHYDHVGYGNSNNSYGPLGYIHNGADDNASGVAVVLELARALAHMKTRPRRTIVFAFWDAEERGLVGSTHWVQNPSIPLSQLKLAVNLDMIGRMRNQSVAIYGVRTATGLRRLISECNRSANLDLTFHWRIRRDSDHFPFFQAQIPFVMPFTGKHKDYHRPSDDIDKLNLKGMRDVAQVMLRLILRVAETDQSSEFRNRSRVESEGNPQSMFAAIPAGQPRLGIRWKRGDTAADGIAVTGITPESAADRAGLRVGDRILHWNSYPTVGNFDFRSLVLATKTSGTAMVLRGDAQQPMPVRVELDGQPQRIGISWREDPADPSVVVLTQVVPGSPAAVAGLRVRDRIHSVDGISLANSKGFLSRVSRPKQMFEVESERSGRLQSHRIQLVPSENSPRKRN